MCRLKSLVAICFVVLLAGCAGGPQTQPPMLNLRRLSDQQSPLALAARSLEYIDLVRERVEIANRIADAYIVQERSADASFILDYAAALAPFSGSSADAVIASAETARLYSRLDRNAAALGLLEDAHQRALAISNDRERGRALDAVIEAAFEGGEDSMDLLGHVVESLFVIEDSAVRAQLLTWTAVRYHHSGNRATMNSLMQQAIPAAGSIANPWQRAAAISELAAAYERTGNRDAAISAIDEAVEEIRRLDNGLAEPADSGYLLQAIANVVLLEQQLSAVELVERLQQAEQRALALTAVAVGYGNQQARSAAYIFFSRAVREASLVDTPAARVRAMTSVADGYLSIGDADLAVIQANGAGSTVAQIAEEAEQQAAGRRVVAIYAAAGEVERAGRFLSDLPEGRPRYAVQVALARELVHYQRDADARSLLRAAFGQGQRVAALAPELAAEVALAFAEAGDTERALDWSTAVEGAADVARALTALGRRGVTAEQLTARERELLLQLQDGLTNR